MSDARPDLPGFQPGLDAALDVSSLKGLAHPIRLKLRSELANHGPATATQLAARIGESTASTSYHLRKLAAHGFIVEDDTLGNGRDRYWRAVHRGLVPLEPFDPAQQEATAAYVRAVAQVFADRIIRFADEVEAAPEVLGEAWSQSWDMSDYGLDLTPDQARELARKFHELCVPYHHEPGRQRPGTSLVRVQFQVLPPPQDGLEP